MNTSVRVPTRLWVATAMVALSAGHLGFVASARGDDAPAPAQTPVDITALAPTPEPPPGSIKISVEKTDEQPMTPGVVVNPLDRLGYGDLPGKSQNKDPWAEVILVKQPMVSKSYATYTISIMNTAKVSAPDLEVEYHLYNVTKQSENYVTLAPEITDISSTQKIAAAPGKAPEITVGHVPAVDVSVTFRPSFNWYGWWENSARVGGKGLNPAASPKQSSDVPVMNMFTNTHFLGSRIIVRHNGTIIAQSDEPGDLDEQLAQIKKRG